MHRTVWTALDQRRIPSRQDHNMSGRVLTAPLQKLPIALASTRKLSKLEVTPLRTLYRDTKV